MDFIAYEGINVALGHVAFALVAIFAISWILCLVAMANSKSSKALGLVATVTFCVAFLLGCVGTVLVSPSTTLAKPVRADNIRSEIDESYGIGVSDEELASLAYPESKPTTKFQSFGSFEQTTKESDGNFVKRELTLLWDDGRMILAQSKNGENFEPLELKR